MSIGNRQIGWSQEENLLWEVSRQLDRMNSILCPCPITTTTTTTSSVTNYNVAGCERMEYHVITYTGNDILPEGTEEVTGKYIIERYLIDDLWETEKVDNIFNQATFLLSKILPTTFMRSSTMGTAATWKLLMLGWSYRKGLAIPHTQPLRPFTGGLSRLLEVGYARNVVKFDFASLYPSIQLSHNVFTDADSTGAMRGLLQYNYDYRNLYKKLV
jgi:DNA polymerase elongation subunit (family B)